MFKKVFSFFALLGVLFHLDAQISIGRYTLARAVAPPLRASVGLTGFTTGFLEAVGGVAFQQTAHPSPDLAVESIRLEYEPGRPDGERVVVIINGQPVRVDLYDWQLQPISRFADSNEHAVFTLFGQLADKRRQDAVIENHGRVVNYHANFQNTLLGLRMLQLDNLLASSEGDDLAVELPQQQGRYILGPGEESPNTAHNRAALQRYRKTISANLGKGSADFRSYVVGDSGRDVQFDVALSALRITGEPGYYFWRYNGDSPAVREQIEKSVEQRLELAEGVARNAQGPNFNEKSWLVQQVSAAVARSAGHPVSTETLQRLRAAEPEELAGLLFELRLNTTLEQQAYKKVVSLTTLNKFVNSRLSMVKAINPVVWDAATVTMRYAAFFRYCKAQNATNWQEFLERVRAVRVEPAVETPAILELASAKVQ